MISDFRRYWTAEVTSTFGSMFTTTAVAIVAVRVFNASAGEVGVITAAAAVPALAFGLLSGAVADRLRRPRRALMACDALAALTVTGLGIGLVTGVASVWWLVGLTLVLGTVVTVVEPVYFTHLSGLVPEDTLVSGRARLQTGEYGATGIGKALAGPAIAIFGGAVAFFIDAGSYLVSLILLHSLRAPDRAVPRPHADEAAAATSLVQEAIQGVREIRHHQLLRGLGGFLVAWSVISGAITALTVPFLLRTLSVPTSLYGLLYAVTGVAGLIGSTIGGALVRRHIRVPHIAFLGFAIGAVTTILLPAAYGSATVAITVAMLGLSLPAIGGAIANIGLTGVLTEDVPGHVLGRVIAALKTAAMTATIIGALGGGFLGDTVGVRTALWLLAAAALLSPVLLRPAIRVTRLRHVPSMPPLSQEVSA